MFQYFVSVDCSDDLVDSASAALIEKLMNWDWEAEKRDGLQEEEDKPKEEDDPKVEENEPKRKKIKLITDDETIKQINTLTSFNL